MAGRNPQAFYQGLLGMGANMMQASGPRVGGSGPSAYAAGLLGFNQGMQQHRQQERQQVGDDQRAGLYDMKQKEFKAQTAASEQAAQINSQKRMGEWAQWDKMKPQLKAMMPEPPLTPQERQMVGLAPQQGQAGPVQPQMPAQAPGPIQPTPGPQSSLGQPLNLALNAGEPSETLSTTINDVGGPTGLGVPSAPAQQPKHPLAGMQRFEIESLTGNPNPRIANMATEYLKTSKGPQGYLRFQGSGERVFPGVEPKQWGAPEFDKQVGKFFTRDPQTGQPHWVSPPSGLSIESTPDGGFKVVQGPGAGGVTKPTQNKIEAELLTLQNGIQNTTDIAQGFNPDWHKYASQFNMAVNEFRDKLPDSWAGLSDTEKEELTAYSDYKSSVVSHFSAILADLSGAAVSAHELKRAEGWVPNMNDSSTVFQGKMNRLQNFQRQATARLHYVRKNGMDISRVSLGQMTGIMQSRGQALEKKHKMKGLKGDALKDAVLQELAPEFGLSAP